MPARSISVSLRPVSLSSPARSRVRARSAPSLPFASVAIGSANPLPVCPSHFAGGLAARQDISHRLDGELVALGAKPADDPPRCRRHVGAVAEFLAPKDVGEM